MIAHVTFEKSTFKDAPHKFEAGTPAIVEAVGLGAALDYIEAIGRDAILAHETDVAEYARERLAAVPGVRIVGHARERGAIVSFTMEQAHPPRYRHHHRPGGRGGARRPSLRLSGHGAFRCRRDGQGLLRALQHESEVDRLVEALDEVAEIFGR